MDYIAMMIVVAILLTVCVIALLVMYHCNERKP